MSNTSTRKQVPERVAMQTHSPGNSPRPDRGYPENSIAPVKVLFRLREELSKRFSYWSHWIIGGFQLRARYLAAVGLVVLRADRHRLRAFVNRHRWSH